MTADGGGVRQHRQGWARVLIERGRAAGRTPSYGSAEWCRLGHQDPRRVAAVVIAAEGWAEHYDSEQVALRLRDELAAERWAAEQLEAEQFAAVAAQVRGLANLPTHEERLRSGYIPRDRTKPPALPRSMWTAEERARERGSAA